MHRILSVAVMPSLIQFDLPFNLPVGALNGPQSTLGTVRRHELQLMSALVCRQGVDSRLHNTRGAERSENCCGELPPHPLQHFIRFEGQDENKLNRDLGLTPPAGCEDGRVYACASS